MLLKYQKKLNINSSSVFCEKGSKVQDKGENSRN